MRRPWQVALVFCICLAVVLAAMEWVSATALRMTQREIEAAWHSGAWTPH